MSEQIVMKATKLFIVFALLQSLFLAVELHAGDAPAPTPYSGDIWNRSTLTGDWGGLRNELAAMTPIPIIGKNWANESVEH